ncbi:MAG: tellurite resistance TerB family protein [Pseudomonadota bacterium]
MFDAKRLLDQFMGSQGGQGGPSGPGDFLKGAGGGVLAGGLAAILMGSKTGRKIGGEALKLGGMAAVGALAYKAYSDWQSGKAAGQASASLPQQQSFPMLPPPSGTPFNPSTESGQQSLARNLLRAMIAAAKADGHVDAQEQARIFAEMDKLPLSSEDKAFVMDELRAKLDVDAVAAAAATPEEAAEIYTASLLSIDVDNAAERGYLAMLAARLKLDDTLVAHLQQTVASAAGKAAQPVG